MVLSDHDLIDPAGRNTEQRDPVSQRPHRGAGHQRPMTKEASAISCSWSANPPGRRSAGIHPGRRRSPVVATT